MYQIPLMLSISLYEMLAWIWFWDFIIAEVMKSDWIQGNRSKSHIGSYKIIDFKDFKAL